MNHIPLSLVVSTRTHEEVEKAALLGADLIEIRLDLLTSPMLQPEMLDDRRYPPLILTLRSRKEGGLFFGTREEWRNSLDPWLDRVSFVDVESDFHEFAGELRSRGKKVIASWHSPLMPTMSDLVRRERSLRSFGDIPKIVVTPASSSDLLHLLSFTLQAEKPICTGVSGSRFRYGRALLPLFGSGFAFCHAGIPTAEGQYHIQEFRKLIGDLLK